MLLDRFRPSNSLFSEIHDLDPDDGLAIQQAAKALLAAFPSNPSWPDLAAALEEVRQSLAPGRISRIACAEDGTILGWIGAIPGYDGHVWEIHPLVVPPNFQRKGIGRALLAGLEELARQRGVLTLWLGTDDEDNRTSLGGANLYPDVLDKLAHIRDIKGHPFSFYLKMGFVLAGVVPDANGLGKPDILMAKHL